MSKPDSFINEIAAELINIIKDKSVSMHMVFYNLDEKKIYMEKDNICEIVYVEYIGIKPNFGYKYKANINKITQDELDEWIRHIYIAIDYDELGLKLDKIRNLQSKLKEANPTFFDK